MIENYFKNKICTVLTLGTNISNLNAEQMVNFFTGTVEEIDEKCILLTSLSGVKTCFYKSNVIGILEEQVVPKESIPMDTNPKNASNEVVSIDTLSSLVS